MLFLTNVIDTFAKIKDVRLIEKRNWARYYEHLDYIETTTPEPILTSSSELKPFTKDPSKSNPESNLNIIDYYVKK